MTVCRGIRGATRADANTPEAIWGATLELLQKLVAANQIQEGDVTAAFFTSTPDLTAAFPATAARQGLGWEHTALMGATEVAVPGSLSRCVRVLILWNTEKPPAQLVNLYLKGTDTLRGNGVESK